MTGQQVQAAQTGRVLPWPDSFAQTGYNAMTWFSKFRDRYLNTSLQATAHYMKTWAYCAHCATHTPWMTRSASGYYKCLECGNNPMEAKKDVETDAATTPHGERPPKQGSTAPASSRQPA